MPPAPEELPEDEEPEELELPLLDPLLLELLLPPLEPLLEELPLPSWELLLPLEQAARPSVRARPQTSPSVGFSVIVRLHQSEAGNTAATWRAAALPWDFSAWLKRRPGY